MANDAKSVSWVGVVEAVLVGLIVAGATLWGNGQSTSLASQPPAGGNQGVTVPPPPPRADTPVMGPLERGVNRQGMDFDAYGRHAKNAALCAEMCRTTAACKAVTYVQSQKTCWLKKVVPPPASPNGPDYISSVKVYPGQQ